MDKVGDKIPKFPVPLPADKVTFERISLKMKKKEKGVKTFGKDSRFSVPDNVKWAKVVEKFNGANAYPNKTLDPKRDPVPGPAAYNLTSHWKGKPEKKKKKAKEPLPNLFEKISTGPSISIYHRR